ncbi:MAG: hypothetical protein WDO56_11295 [Gammaproteobacteria bacterium]
MSVSICGHLAIGLDLETHGEPVDVAVFADAAEQGDLPRFLVDEVEPVGGRGRRGLPQAIAHRDTHAVFGVFHVALSRKTRGIVFEQSLQIGAHHAGKTAAVMAAIRVCGPGAAGTEHKNQSQTEDRSPHGSPPFR